MPVQSTPYSEDRERAVTLARSGDYEDWRAVCRKMLFEGWRIEVFNENAFTDEVDRICAREHAHTH